jgi:hypothetical protein
MVGSDFWWLSCREATKYPYIGLGHHRSIGDEEQPYDVSWDRSFNQIGEIDRWREKFANVNIYRSLTLFSAEKEQLVGPFIIDVDNCNEDLEDALAVTRMILSTIVNRFSIDVTDLKLFFTGHKGFNFEVRPCALGINGTYANQLKQSSELRSKIIKEITSGKSQGSANQVSVNETVIDLTYGDRFSGFTLNHPFVRLHESINEWITSGKQVIRRRKIELALDKFHRMSVSDIVTKSEQGEK